MEFVVYILFSESFNKKYIGVTSNLIARFKSHNQLGTKGWTIKFRPWKVIHIDFFNNKHDALLREKELKSGKGRDWIKSKYGM